MSNGNQPYRTSVHDEFMRSFDPLVHALTIIDEGHRMAHDGFMYHMSGKQTGLANGATASFLMRTPAGVYPHWNRVLLSFGRGDVDIVTSEDAIVSADGTPLTAIRNTNRNSSNTAEMLFFANPTITDTGTNLHTLWAVPTGTGQGNTIGISDISNGEEWIMKPSTDYLMQITNNSGAAIDYSYEMLWYEAHYIK